MEGGGLGSAWASAPGYRGGGKARDIVGPAAGLSIGEASAVWLVDACMEPGNDGSGASDGDSNDE